MLEWETLSVEMVPPVREDEKATFTAMLGYGNKKAQLDEIGEAVSQGADPASYVPSPVITQAFAELRLERNESTGKLAVTEVTITGEDVTTALLRTLPLAKVTTTILTALKIRYGEETVSDVGEIKVTADDRKQWPRGDKERVSKLVTKIFTKATDMNIPPIPEIAKKFEVSNRTASRMVAYSREIGDLPPVP